MAKIMLVDQIYFMRQNVKRIVEQGGHSVVAESDGGILDIAKLCKEQSPDVLITGISCLDAKQLADMKCLIERFPRLMAIVYGYEVNKKYVLEAVGAGAFWVFVKPLDGERLLQEIENCMVWSQMLAAA